MRLKRILALTIVLVFILSNNIFSETKNNYDIRKLNWGMTKEQVMESENTKPLKIEEDSLVFNVKVLEIDSLMLCNFYNDSLYELAYSFNNEHENKNLYIDDYERIKGMLIKKYGNPSYEGLIWLNDEYKEDKNNWGEAISCGYLHYIHEWKYKNMSISLYMTNNKDNEIITFLAYENIEMKNIIKQKKSEETNSEI